MRAAGRDLKIELLFLNKQAFFNKQQLRTFLESILALAST